MESSQSPDVLVVGAGASGAALSWRLASNGFRVTCLEQGSWVTPDRMPAFGVNWQSRRQTDWNADPNLRQLPEDYPVENTGSAFTPLMFNAVGGSTIHWSAHFPRFHPSDFRVKSLDGVADDWPLHYSELAPYYDLNDREIGVSGLAGDPAYPDRPRRPTPPLPIGSFGQTLVDGFNRLGWHWWVSDTATISAPYGKGRQPCNLCGPCDLGCPTGARSSADVAYWPRALANGVRLVTNARVREITVNPDGTAKGALYYDGRGDLQQCQAPIVVVACNGVGTPRLLLNSRSRQFPDGLANRNGLVGRNLMFHPFGVVCGVFGDELDSSIGPVGSILYSHEFYETDARRGFVRGYSLQAVRQSGPLHAAMGGLAERRLPWGDEHHRTFKERFNHIATLGVMGEDLPEELNRVTLDSTLVDSHGIPAPRVSYRLSDNSEAMLDHGIARATEVLKAAGATKVLVNRVVRPSGWHLLGTARMGDKPSTSVVNRLGATHDVPNLFVVDGSVFTTSAAVNPTSTIQALALRTADYLIANRHQF